MSYIKVHISTCCQKDYSKLENDIILQDCKVKVNKQLGRVYLDFISPGHVVELELSTSRAEMLLRDLKKAVD